MGLLGLLMVVPFILVMMVGMNPVSPLTWLLSLGIALSIAGGIWILFDRGFDLLLSGWMTQSEYMIAARRRILKNRAVRTKQETRLESMDEAELRAHLEHKPKDALALEILCERLLAEGKLAEYAREMEYLLTTSNDLSREESCSRYQRLADLYLNQLGRPDRAREMLQALIARFPRHYQATLARRRLAELNDQAPGGVGH